MRGSRPTLQVLLVAVVGVGAGLVGGWLWESRWTPATGVALNETFVLDGQGAPVDFSGTASYVAWALAVGVVAGVLAGLVTRDRELLTLVVLLVSTALGGVAMAWLGHALGPPDPAPLAATLDDFTPMTSDLRVHGVAPLLALPAGGLLGLATAYVGEVAILRVRQPAAEPPATLNWH